jgi:hypothetical protein
MGACGRRFIFQTATISLRPSCFQLGLPFVRPAWAHSRRCKSSRKLTTASEVKRNCMRATECGKEAWSVNHEPMDKNRIEGGADQGERARNRKAFVVKDQAA